MKTCRVSPRLYSKLLTESRGPRANPIFTLMRPGDAPSPDTLVLGLTIKSRPSKAMADAARFDPVITGRGFGT